MNTSQLDVLPVELIHHLLSYFSAHEILYSFAHVTSYIDSILASYTDYRINFKAIRRSHFDLVCQQVEPDQVIALTLSNDEDTPGLIDLFLSRFQIDQFTRLRGLKLIDIGADFWAAIIEQMVTLQHLQSFFYSVPAQSNSWICNLSSAEITELDKSLFDTYAPILPQLHQLRLNHGDFLHSVSFDHLRHLILGRSSIDLIKHICSTAPQLRSLNTCFSLEKSPAELIPPMPQLNCLILEISSLAIPMNTFEQMISNLPRLRQLELVSHCNEDVIDGQRWEITAKNLITFKFRFRSRFVIKSHQLDLFRTPFWMTVKKWFVASRSAVFFSVSQSNMEQTDSNFEHPHYTTVPDVGIFNQHIHELLLSADANYLNDHFPNVQTLILDNDPPPLETIRKVVDLRQIRSLRLHPFSRTFPIVTLINEMQNLCELWIEFTYGKFLNKIHRQVLEKIRTLRINKYERLVQGKNNQMESIFLLLPDLQHLHVNDQCSIEEIRECLCEFKHLSQASFTLMTRSSTEDKKQYRLHIQPRLDQMRHEEGFNFTYRFSSGRVYFWMGS